MGKTLRKLGSKGVQEKPRSQRGRWGEQDQALFSATRSPATAERNIRPTRIVFQDATCIRREFIPQ